MGMRTILNLFDCLVEYDNIGKYLNTKIQYKLAWVTLCPLQVFDDDDDNNNHDDEDGDKGIYNIHT